jgi:23S rRNA (guanosine2251-2'-O)-methyltransferase
MDIEQDLICGPHAVLAALKNQPRTVSAIWISESRIDRRVEEIIAAARLAQVKYHRVPRARLDHMAGHLPHQGVLARGQPETVRGERDIPAFVQNLTETPLLLILDGVQDPHNFGACLRAANGAGAHAVIVPRDRSAPLTAAVRRAAAGAVETTPVFRVINLARTLRVLKDLGVWLIGATQTEARIIDEADFRAPSALILGGEDKGLRRLVRDHCDLLVRIPMCGEVESLNVSVAAGICLFEALRQRRARARK